jgi:hypothetical protein
VAFGQEAAKLGVEGLGRGRRDRGLSVDEGCRGRDGIEKAGMAGGEAGEVCGPSWEED